jgi:hypothetical protein
MPIARNLNLGATGSRMAAAALAPGFASIVGGITNPGVPPPPAPDAGGALGNGAPSPLGGLFGGLGLGGGGLPEAPPPPPITTPPLSPTINLRPALTVRPDIRAMIDPSLLFPVRPTPTPAVDRTTTQLAQGAIAQLAAAAPPTVREAMNTVINAGSAPADLMHHLERFVRVGEALNELAARWSETTRGDFAKAFTNMDVAKTDVMDAIVSLAILNDPDLPQELLAENTPQTAASDLQNRKVVWQSPPPGTPLQPPYVVLIAVEWSDVAKAQDIVKSITDQLVEKDRFKMPRAAADKL